MTGAAHEEPTAPGPGAGHEHDLDPGDLTVLVVVTKGSVKRLPKLLDSVAADDTLHRLTVTVVHPRAVTPRVSECVEGRVRVRTVEADSGSRADVARAVAQDLPFVTTPYVVAHELRDLSTARAAYGAARRAVRQLDAPVDGLPLLLPTAQTPRQVAAGYVAFAHDTPQARVDGHRDRLGALMLTAAEPRLEAVDPRGGDLEVRLWLNAPVTLDGPPPAWRVRVLLVGSDGATVRSEPVALRQRAHVLGGARWEDVVARVPVGQAATGEHRLAVEVDTEHEALRRRRWVGPRKGALLAGRTVLTRPSEGRPLRYLVHTTGPGTQTHVTVQHGDGWPSRLRWSGRLLRKDLAFVARGSDERGTKGLRLLRLATKPLYAGREVWLVGERYDTAQDNGVHLFRHLSASPGPRRRSVYYVIDRDSPQRSQVAPFGEVVDHSSRRHRLLMLHADVLANAYSMHYLVPRQWSADSYARHLAWRVGALRLYLKHGVHLSPNAVKRGLAGYDVVITVTPRETEALRAVSGYQEQLVETGLPRYDALTPGPRTRTVLFMSTWRRYLVPKVFGGEHDAQVPFEGSDYDRFMTGFLASPRLQEMLETYDYRLAMLPHYNLAHHFSTMPLAGDRVALADTESHTFQELIRGCDAFLTDHSSVHFDVAYLGTPIIYARFDQHDFETRHAAPGWFDYEQDGFGPVTHTLGETLDALEELLRRDCEQDPFYATRVAETFPHRDQHNSRRVVEAVESRLAGRRTGIPGPPSST